MVYRDDVCDERVTVRVKRIIEKLRPYRYKTDEWTFWLCVVLYVIKMVN